MLATAIRPAQCQLLFSNVGRIDCEDISVATGSMQPAPAAETFICRFLMANPSHGTNSSKTRMPRPSTFFLRCQRRCQGVARSTDSRLGNHRTHDDRTPPLLNRTTRVEFATSLSPIVNPRGDWIRRPVIARGRAPVRLHPSERTSRTALIHASRDWPGA